MVPAFVLSGTSEESSRRVRKEIREDIIFQPAKAIQSLPTINSPITDSKAIGGNAGTGLPLNSADCMP